MKINTPKSPIKKIIIIALCVIIAACLGYGVYAKSNTAWPFSLNETQQDGNDASSAKGNDDLDVDEANTNEENDITENKKIISPGVEERVKKGEGSGQKDSTTSGTGIFDTRGKNVSNQSGGVSSKSGAMTLYTPAENEKLTSGTIIKGSTSASKIYYRINDNLHGMIGSGQLTPKSGKFSGELSVNTGAKAGSFEVYNLNSSGQEINNISIQVRY